jgi:reverse gyrase
MASNLVIVESPAKASTIKKYLGKDYEVLASYGHVRDLLPKEGAVDTEHNFEMRYEVIERNSKHVDAIAKCLKKADKLFLATDLDREGEAISWHLVELLKERNLLEGKESNEWSFMKLPRGRSKRRSTIRERYLCRWSTRSKHVERWIISWDSTSLRYFGKKLNGDYLREEFKVQR